MTKYKKFLTHFTFAFILVIIVIFGLVSAMDPFRNLNFPWRIDFVSDRNPPYKRFKLLNDAEGVTDLVIGSSTSEVFVPQVLNDRFGVKAFASNSGGASLPLRYLMIQHALAVQPSLKRIIYVADLFEFSKPKVDNTIYYQPEMMKYLDGDIAMLSKPDWTLRFNDYFSSLVIDRSIRTAKDYLAFNKGTYGSAYHADGSTTQSMIGGRSGDVLENRVKSSALGMQSVYGEMKDLDPDSVLIFKRLEHLIAEHPNVELHLIIAPFHELFYEHYKTDFEKTRLYSKWVKMIQSAQAKNILVHDFSYPQYLKAGIDLNDRFWQDGTHFTSELMLKMAEQIYPFR